MDEFEIGTRFFVHGFVMLKHLEDGDTWKIVAKDAISYTLRKVLRNGQLGKKVVRHHRSSIECWTGGHPDNINRLEILGGTDG